ncbi:conserved hypothetical protein, partial [Ricinus communis]
MVFVGEAAAGPAHVRHLDRFQRRHHVVADAARVGDGRIAADPDAAVDAVSKVFGELAEDVAVDDRARRRRVDADGDRLRRGGRHRRHHGQLCCKLKDFFHGKRSKLEKNAAADFAAAKRPDRPGELLLHTYYNYHYKNSDPRRIQRVVGQDVQRAAVGAAEDQLQRPRRHVDAASRLAVRTVDEHLAVGH